MPKVTKLVIVSDGVMLYDVKFFFTFSSKTEILYMRKKLFEIPFRNAALTLLMLFFSGI